jgi:hypothetical protein
MSEPKKDPDSFRVVFPPDSPYMKMRRRQFDKLTNEEQDEFFIKGVPLDKDGRAEITQP